MGEVEAGEDRDRLVRELGSNPEVEVSIAVGTEHFRTGHITLTVRGDGRVRVLQRRAGRETPYEATWESDRLKALGVELASTGFCGKKPLAEEREPDDVPVTLTLEVAGGDRLCVADLWHGDRYQDPGLDKLLARFDAIVSEVTGGVLPYGRPKL